MQRRFWTVVTGGLLYALVIPGVLAQDNGGAPPPEPPPEEGRGRNNVNSRHLLLPPEDAADQDARGNFWLRQNPVRSGLIAQACGLEPGVTFDVRISLGGESELLGNITTAADGGDGMDDGDGGRGCGKLRLDTKRGDTLPLGAESVADLVGAVVDIVDPDGNVVLTTEVVNLEVNTPAGDRPGDGDDGRRGPPEDVPPAGVPPEDGPPDDVPPVDVPPDDVPPEDAGDDDTGDGGGASIEPPLPEELFLVAGRHDATFVRGDSNMDKAVNIADPIATLSLLFGGGGMPYCEDAADANDDGAVNLTDAVAVLSVLFLGEGSLPSPGLAPGFDPTADDLFCDLENGL